MRLIVSGLPLAGVDDRFKSLFGRYVYGFKSWTHRDGCFVARRETRIDPEMKDGSVELRDELFYLCGVGRQLSFKVHPYNARKSTNVHLAVWPRKGSVAAVGSVYGAKLVARDKHSRCRMFRFAYQMVAGETAFRVTRKVLFGSCRVDRTFSAIALRGFASAGLRANHVTLNEDVPWRPEFPLPTEVRRPSEYSAGSSWNWHLRQHQRAAPGRPP